MNFNTVLKDKLETKLRAHLGACNITIEVIGSDVSLKGIVNSYEVKEKIEELIISCPDVASVNNELAIFNEN